MTKNSVWHPTIWDLIDGDRSDQAVLAEREASLDDNSGQMQAQPGKLPGKS